MLPSIILNVILFIVAWMFRSKWFKIKVHIDIINSNTSSILTKQSCLLKITWPKKAIPTKSYSLAMLHLHHIKYLNHAQPWWQANQLFHTFDVVKPFQLSRNTWAWAMDIALWWKRIWWLWRRQKEGDSLTSTRRINGLWRCPSIDIKCEWVGITMQRMH